MHIGLIATPWIPVPPRGYGGTEAVLDNLARGLQEMGHDVSLFTVGESTCNVTRSYMFPECMEPMNDSGIESMHVEAAYRTLLDAGVDVIHDHTTVGPLLGSQAAAHLVPVTTTVHGPFTTLSRELYGRIAKHVPVIAISRTQRARAGTVPIEAVIHHGIDTDRYLPGAGDGGYLAFVGRMSPHKGVHRAIAVANRAQMPLVIMAKMREQHERQYFENVVKPLLSSNVEVLFEPDETRRIDMLGKAAALINPITWPEPFGLVMAESLACGTPVIGSPFGAAKEIVRPGVTGYLHRQVADLARSVELIGDIDRIDCRAEVHARFSMRRMVSDHIQVYESLIQRNARQAPAQRVNGYARPTVPPPVASLEPLPVEPLPVA